MTPRYAVLCLLTLIIAALLFSKNYEMWTSPAEVPVEKAVPRKGQAKPDLSQPAGEPKDGKDKDKSSIASYIFIAEKNPFHPDRKEFPVLPGAAGAGAPDPSKEVKKPPVRPQVTLYGVTLAGDYQAASISYPRTLKKGEREVFTVKIGDRVGEYKLARILEDRIGLETPEDNFEVLLYDAKNPKKRVFVKTDNKPAAVTSTVPGAAPAAAPTARPGPSPAPGEKREAPVPGGVAAAPAPAAVTPATTPGTPSSRTRRWYGPRTPGSE